MNFALGTLVGAVALEAAVILYLALRLRRINEGKDI